jgi:hypothetical protein
MMLKNAAKALAVEEILLRCVWSSVLLDDGNLRELLISIECATLRRKRRVQRHRRISPTQYQHEDKGAFSISCLV